MLAQIERGPGAWAAAARMPAALRPVRRSCASSRTGQRRRVVRRQHAGRTHGAARGRYRMTTGPISASIASTRGAAGPQQARRRSPLRSSTVDSTPTAQGPLSSTASMRPPSPSSTCCAVVGLTWPERLADGAATGRPTARSSASAVRRAPARAPPACPDPAPVSSATGQSGRRGSTSVSGPGHSAAARRRAASFGDDMGECRVGVRVMADQRIEARPLLGREDARHRLGIGGIGAQPVHRFGAERDQPAVAQQRRGAGDAGIVGGRMFRHARA